MSMLPNKGQEFYTRENGKKGLRKVFHGESLTRTSFTEDCDVNKIIEKFVKTGQISHYNIGSPTYGDFSEISDYAGVLRQIIDTNDQFQELPAKVRARFKNDPQELINFLGDDSNYEEAIKLGFIEKSKAEAFYKEKAKKMEEAQQKAGQEAEPSQAKAKEVSAKEKKSKD